eukprot:5074353-Amphidinium_carterae.1
MEDNSKACSALLLQRAYLLVLATEGLKQNHNGHIQGHNSNGEHVSLWQSFGLAASLSDATLAGLVSQLWPSCCFCASMHTFSRTVPCAKLSSKECLKPLQFSKRHVSSTVT